MLLKKAYLEALCPQPCLQGGERHFVRLCAAWCCRLPAHRALRFAWAPPPCVCISVGVKRFQCFTYLREIKFPGVRSYSRISAQTPCMFSLSHLMICVQKQSTPRKSRRMIVIPYLCGSIPVPKFHKYLT